MKIKIKKVYYCDYCKKHSLRSIAHHELHCTGNPNRECGMCDRVLPVKMEVLKSQMDSAGFDSTRANYVEINNVKKPKFQDISDEADGCPACILAILRQTGLNKYPYNGYVEFNYKKAVDDWWHEENKEQERNFC